LKIFPEALFDALGQGLDMGPGGPGGYDEHVGQNEQIFDVEEDNVDSLLGEDGIGGPSSQIFTLLYDSRSSRIICSTISPDSGFAYRLLAAM
jgi:hypothetical protein